MRIRDRLASPWLTASLAVVLLALAGAGAIALGLVSLPRIDVDLSFFSYQPSHPAGAVATPGPTSTPTSATPEPTFTRPTPSPAPTFTMYTVRVGDSLSSIATTYHTTARSIAWWNRGTYPSLDPESPAYKPNRLELGWVLTILPGAVVDENNPPTPSPPPGAATPLPSPS